MSWLIKNIIIAFISTISILVLFIFFQIAAGALSKISYKEGTYKGEIISTHDGGIYWNTYGFSAKTTGNSSNFEKFCVIDKKLIQKINNLKDGQRVNIKYKKIILAPSWKCDLNEHGVIAVSVEEV